MSDDEDEAVLECEDSACGRRLLYRRPKDIEVIQHGGASALHWFQTGLGTSVSTPSF